MRIAKTLSLIALIGILLSSCAKVFYSPDAYSLAKTHSLVAILPPSVSIAASRKVEAALAGADLQSAPHN
jgi:PBP1b-binding outer membrane lipoprotein LpoB